MFFSETVARKEPAFEEFSFREHLLTVINEPFLELSITPKHIGEFTVDVERSADHARDRHPAGQHPVHGPGSRRVRLGRLPVEALRMGQCEQIRDATPRSSMTTR